MKANRGPNAAAENRRALVSAAADLFATDGPATPMSAVARRAGVGQGSLYRHFPDRLSLALAVFDDNVAALEALAGRPSSTLADLLALVAEQAALAGALIDLISAEPTDPRALAVHRRVSDVAATVAERERAAGRIAPTVTGEDLLLAIGMLAVQLPRLAPAARPAAARRSREILLAAFAPDSRLGPAA